MSVGFAFTLSILTLPRERKENEEETERQPSVDSLCYFLVGKLFTILCIPPFTTSSIAPWDIYLAFKQFAMSLNSALPLFL